MKQLPAIILLLFVILACKEIFEPPPQSMLEAAIRYSDSKQSESPAISVYGLGMDSIWIYQEKTDLIRLPLSKEVNSTFVILFDSIPDTLTINHDTKLSYGSVESGFYTEHWINNIEHTWHRIDSVAIVDSAVTQFWHENIQLYINNLPAVAN